MDQEQVTEFLGQVPLLQCLPGSSIRKIAETVQVKHYGPGDYVAREGEPVDGLYIILDGQAEVSAPANAEEANRPDYILNKYDYFGYGTNSSVHQVNVVALSKALAAASKTVDCLKLVHSLHAIFLVAGDNNLPIIYQVHRARDGSSFATRKVEAKQKGQGRKKWVLSIRLQLLNLEEIRERRLTDPRFPILNYWFKARGKLSDDQALHRCVVAYASDLLFSGVSLNPHREKGLKTYSLSLDHSIWFHKPVKADDWLLYAIESPSAHGGRGFVTGRMFNRQGELIMSLTQEALIRKEKTRGPNPRPKL
ncbi:hypothetical protein PR202_ga19418 [Eleusine coracana subsp. coracana]|uniref:Cyclic nucleotide-binding domain-containing protein n=1 Tax=Eleusine coracana subsp. coracana TaxID=191504 RepID=A0AAV5CU67_ELECO|nr:hypothetical protein PR202_ga19418 [Eleusine coracana subsp. coracana]